MEQREKLGGSIPVRINKPEALKVPDVSIFKELIDGTGEREASTTMSFVRLLSILTKDKSIGKHVVPIVPDEARTFGMDPLFRQLGIYAHSGQLYDPVDSDQFLYYKEEKNGQILEEGINEAGAISSFIAAGMSYSNHGIHMVPFYIYYSMFGFQRVWDLIWAAGDMRVRGFLLGGTAGRTTLNGEGLQHQDGHSHLAAAATPNIKSYDCAYAYEIAIIVQRGMVEMVEENKDVIYYLTLENENYIHPSNNQIENFQKIIENNEKLSDVRSDYLKRLKTHGSNGVKYICDKMPHNFILIGLIKTIFPEAKIIYCKRDPIDNCFSLYSHKFIELSHQYSYDQITLVHYYRLHEDLMKFWLAKHKNDIFVLDNEELVNNQEVKSKELVKHCGLRWENECLEFYKNKRQVRTASIEQVRKPMTNKSIGAWKKYEKNLENMIQELKK